MVSCFDLWRIGSQLTKACSESGFTFGGKSVVLAGDFAQLPPASGGSSLYGYRVGNSSTKYAQRCAFGKALWHEFTTVVILRQNMRQRGMSGEDVLFRAALENMRYCQCTKEDEKLILSRVWRPTPENRGQLPKEFRDVSIITAWNAHRDAINAVRVKEFAQLNRQRLYHFHSVDRWAATKDFSSVRRAQRAYHSTVDPTRTSDHICAEIQNALWELPPAITGNQAGVLSLCEGMPILLKYNEATELCATNGAEAVVESWDSHVAGTHDILDTLYVRLTSPPRDVYISGLPKNVVPLTRSHKTITCTLPINDIQVTVSREQVMILPNFAMTDYCSQGRTRLYNLLHLTHCRNHQALYTALSRSSSLRNTLLLGSFNTAKIRGGASRELRREY
ncbi:hypothetical protein BV20DRAFT_905374, partial [Pilatotrama ljubarskyi]